MDMIKKRAAMRGQSGFTLVELLVAVAILAVLAGVAVFAVGNLTGQSEAAACETEGETLVTAATAAQASPDSTDTVDDYLQGGTASLKYFDNTGARTAATLTAVTATDCGDVTLP